MSNSLFSNQDPTTLFGEHPTVRAAAWHIDGLKREEMDPSLWFNKRELEEVAQFKSEKRRAEWLAARIALKYLLLEDQKILSPLHLEVRKNQLGQPKSIIYIPETGHYEELACSLSHKNNMVVAAYARTNATVGVDIERRSWRLSRLRRRFESEEDSLLGGVDSTARDTVLWAFKEATSKLLGTGFACGFTRIVCRERRYGICEVRAPDGDNLFGAYLWLGKYVVAIVTDTLKTQGAEPKAPDHATARPWREQIARARRLRKLRQTRTKTEQQDPKAATETDSPINEKPGDDLMVEDVEVEIILPDSTDDQEEI